MKADHNQSVTVIKLNPQREETWRYQGQILKQEPHQILVEARFNHSDLTIHGIHLKRKDRFLEYYFDDRWYNIFKVYDHEDDHLKGWYCNITRPAEFEAGVIKYVDLALDVLIYPDGKYLVLDEDEFADLDISESERKSALDALNDLLEIIQNGDHPQFFS